MNWTDVRKGRSWLQWLLAGSFALLLWAWSGGTAYAQLEDFNTFTGTGFSPTPAAGQLDSNTWIMTGLSDGSMSFGDTKTTDDFARGTANGGVRTGGVYAFDVGGGDSILGIQPGGSDFTPGTFQLKRTNQTGSAVTEVAVSYDIWTYNDKDRSNSLNFAYATNCTTYTSVPALDYVTPITADALPAWVKTARSTILTVSLAPNDLLCLQWTGDDVNGSGSRDEYGIDNVYVSLEAPTLVELARFDAAVEGDDIILTWETGAEIDVAGFNLYRSLQGAEERTPVNERLIGPRGQLGQGASYAFRDRPGKGVFEYWLEDLDTAGIPTLHGPVMASTATAGETPASRLFLPVIAHP